MRVVADFHIHSKYSRATSKDMNIDTLSVWAKKKGINLLGTGDFTHPGWLGEIRSKLVQGENGFLSPKNNRDVDFILSSEISSIYTQDNKVRKIHNIVLVPTISSAEKISKKFGETGNIWSDGRPIFGKSAYEVTSVVLDIEPKAIVIPAHIWTPWFSLFGANSGFDTIKECYRDLTDQIFAVETGLSSDPEMNWRLSQLDKITLVSNSDSHSPAKIGREANVFEFQENKFSYDELRNILKNKDASAFLYTIEFFPEEGKYHYDGHRNCNVVMTPKETKKAKNICPVCGRKLTIGVMHRVEELADRPEGYKPKGFPKSKHLVPLTELIADIRGVGPQSKAVLSEYDSIVNVLGSEIDILDTISIKKIQAMVAPDIADSIQKMRAGKISAKPGYDGVYGVISIQGKEDKLKESLPSAQVPAQDSLF